MKSIIRKAKQTEEMRSLRRKVKILEKVVLERKGLEKALRESEKRVRQLSDATFEGIAIHEKGRILEVNRAFCQMFGYDRSEVIGKLATELAAPEYRDLVRQKIASGDTKPYEGVSMKKDGTTFTVELVGKPISYHGRTARVTVFRDITERKRVAEALEKSFSELQATLDSTDDAILVVDTEGRISSYNRRFLELWHIPKQIMTTKDDKKAIQYVLNQLKEPEKFLAKVEELYSHPDAESFDVLEFTDGRIFERYSQPQRLDGRSIGRVWSFRDVTERKRGEKALQESVKQFRDLAEKTPSMIFINQKGRIVYANEKCSEIMGYTIEEFLSPTFDFRRLIAPESLPLALEKFEEHQKGREVAPYEYVLITKHGQKFHTIHTTRLITFNGERAILGILTDITERTRSEKALKQSEEQFSRIFNTSPMPITLSRLSDGTFIDANNSFLRLGGFTRSEVIGHTPPELRLYPDPEKRSAILKSLHTQGRLQNHEQPFRTKSGRIVDTLLWLELISINNEPCVLALALDVTEHKQAELLQNAVYQISQATDKATNLDDLFRSVHEIIGTVMPAKNFYISLYDDEKDLISFPYFVDEVDSVPAPRKLRKGLTEYVLRSGKALLCDEATNSELRQSGKVELVGALSAVWVGVPLIVEDKAIGVMVAQHYKDSKAYGEREMRMLEYVSSQVAKAVDRKRAEESLRHSEARLKSLFAAIADVILVLDAEGRYLEIAPTNPALLYRPAKELIGKTLHEVFPPAKADFFLESVQRALKSQERVNIDYSLHIGDKDIWFAATLSPMSPSTVLLIARDVSERKIAEEALASETAYFEVLFQDSPSGIAILDDDDRIVSVNKSFERMFQYTSEEARGRRINECIVPPNLINEAEGLSQMTQQGHVVSKETVRRRKDGSIIPVNIIGYPIHIEGKRVGIYGMYEDISERKQLEVKMIQAQKIESIGTLASGIAHDFNNILGIILGYSTLVENNVDAPEKLSRYMQSINAAVQRGADLVSQILTFARKTEVLFSPIDVNVMIQGIVKMLRETFPKTIDFALHLVPDIPLITADATQVHQVLLNVAVNARDAMPVGGVLTFTTEVMRGSGLRNVFTDIGNGYYAHVCVSDTGIGMDETTRSHIFDPFFTTKEKGKGTGLGLSVVYGVMKNHNGFIDVQSEPGKGSTFNLYFPIREESPPIAGRKIEKGKEIKGGSETILVVEDEEALLMMMKILLEEKGYRVLTASDGLAALNLFRQHKDEIALVLTDVGLPKIGGDQLFFELKKVSASVRVILASGYVDPGTKAEILEAGAGGFVQKPYVPDTVFKKIRDMIDRK